MDNDPNYAYVITKTLNAVYGYKPAPDEVAEYIIEELVLSGYRIVKAVEINQSLEKKS